MVILAVAVLLFSLFLMPGLVGVQPNQSVVLTLFGRYVGSVREGGLRWVNPFFTKKRVVARPQL